jgi:hypothetical protein
VRERWKRVTGMREMEEGRRDEGEVGGIKGQNDVGDVGGTRER